MAQKAEEREAEFWDAAARRITDDALLVRKEAQDEETLFQLRQLGDLAGKRVLEVGCGTGEWAVLLALYGAEVWAVDISPESVEATKRRAALNHVESQVNAAVMSATEMEYPDRYFDIVHGANIVHHLDAGVFGKEVARVLKTGGVAVFSENSANNAILMAARNLLCGRFGISKWSSSDEYPLTKRNIASFAEPFKRCELHYPCFLFLHYLNAKIFKYRYRGISRVFFGLDGFVYRYLPFLRKYSYRQIVVCADPITG